MTKTFVKIVTLEVLQPMVTEATIFMKEIDPCKLEVEDSNGD